MYVVAPYNDALLLYIAGIGLGGYGFVHGLVRLDARAMEEAFGRLPRRGLAWLLIGLTALFATMWLVSIGHPVAPVLATILLVKTLTLGLALLSMNAFIAASTGLSDPSEPVIWTVVVVVSLAWLVFVVRRLREPDRAWLRPSMWS